MSAMSVLRASETPPPANPFVRDAIASLRTVVVPGRPATYANLAVLRGMGLRWDPERHRWHGATTPDQVRELRERLGLEVRVFGVIEALPKGPAAPRPAIPRPTATPIALPTCDQPRRPHDGSRTCFESRIAIPSGEEPEEFPTSTRRFTVWETTSGMPDDCREEEERAVERRLSDLRGRVKSARTVVATMSGLAEILASDSQRAARFYARFAVTEATFRYGVLADFESSERFARAIRQPADPPIETNEQA